MGLFSGLFGGVSAGNKQTASTTTSTTNTTYNNTDKRAVADNGATAVTGDFNDIYSTDDRDVFNSLSLSSWSDNSNRSTTNVDASNRSTSNYSVDASNRSTSNYNVDTSNRSTTTNSYAWDSSDRSTNHTTTNLTMTDLGALDAARSMMEQASITDRLSIQTGAATMDRVFSGAFDTVNKSAGYVAESMADALGFGRDAFDFAADARGAVEKANERVADAYKDATSKVLAAAGSAQSAVVGAYAQQSDTASGNRPLIIAGVIVAGLVALSVLKKG